MSVQQERPHSFGCPINGRRQAGRSCSHDHKVIQFVSRRRGQPQVFGELLLVRVSQCPSVFEKQSRQFMGRHARRFQKLPCVRISLDVEPSIRYEVACEEVFHLVGSR